MDTLNGLYGQTSTLLFNAVSHHHSQNKAKDIHKTFGNGPSSQITATQNWCYSSLGSCLRHKIDNLPLHQTQLFFL